MTIIVLKIETVANGISIEKNIATLGSELENQVAKLFGLSMDRTQDFILEAARNGSIIEGKDIEAIVQKQLQGTGVKSVTQMMKDSGYQIDP
jgi:hypothetical protein